MRRIAFLIFVIMNIATICAQQLNTITRAAENGDIEAQMYLGNLFLNGSSTVSPNRSLAYKWYLAAAEQGNIEAQGKLGFQLRDLSGDKADFWRWKAADGGLPSAMWALYYDLKKANDPKAKKYLETLVLKYDVATFYTEYGLYCLYGIWMTKDLEKARFYFQKAIDVRENTNAIRTEDSINSIEAEGYYYMSYYHIFKENMDQAISCLRKSYELNPKPTTYSLLFNVLVKTHNNATAKEYTEQEIKKNNPEAIFYMGALCLWSTDKSGAKKWFLKAIEVAPNYYEAIDELAWLYYKDNEYMSAKKYFNMMVDKGWPDGYNGLAYMYAYGYGVSKNLFEAHRLIDKAIEITNQEDTRYLDSKGEFYLIDNNFTKAKEIYNKCLNIDPDFGQKESTFVKSMKQHHN